MGITVKPFGLTLASVFPFAFLQSYRLLFTLLVSRAVQRLLQARALSPKLMTFGQWQTCDMFYRVYWLRVFWVCHKSYLQWHSDGLIVSVVVFLPDFTRKHYCLPSHKLQTPSKPWHSARAHVTTPQNTSVYLAIQLLTAGIFNTFHSVKITCQYSIWFQQSGVPTFSTLILHDLSINKNYANSQTVCTESTIFADCCRRRQIKHLLVQSRCQSSAFWYRVDH